LNYPGCCAGNAQGRYGGADGIGRRIKYVELAALDNIDDVPASYQR
jgi:hypothetical protein